MIPIILWEARSHVFGRLLLYWFGGLAWIVGWKVVALRLGCNVLSLCNSMYLVDYNNINSFHKHCCVDDV